MHAVAFECGRDTEEMFKFLQLVSCCFFSLSHGANDVANAVGPFASVWMIHSTRLPRRRSGLHHALHLGRHHCRGPLQRNH